MYTGKNFKKKEDLEKAIKQGQKVTIFVPKWVKKRTGIKTVANGIVPVMGPHLKLRNLRDESDKTEEVRQHEWFATARVENGVVKDVY